ncbi:GNAT family N-acetyltransferase [Oceanimonas baumannii]|uniref:GNAT family N-acetyltransferase n=1 Tax=Oceanimonas baumannii TaxID=129578 RepID=UPI003A8D47BD
MRIIESPSNKQLDLLQAELNEEKNVGIVDIYGPLISFYLAAEDKNSILGVVGISFDEGDDCAEIYKLYVSPSHRKKGVSTFLLKSAIDILVSKNVKKLYIESTDNSRSFWAKNLAKYKCETYDYNKFSIIIG